LLDGQVRLGLLVAKADVARPVVEVERETAQLVRNSFGPVASFVAGLPKTRSGKILCGRMRKIAEAKIARCRRRSMSRRYGTNR
jgi:propionyl-CoA synthetase